MVARFLAGDGDGNVWSARLRYDDGD